MINYNKWIFLWYKYEYLTNTFVSCQQILYQFATSSVKLSCRQYSYCYTVTRTVLHLQLWRTSTPMGKFLQTLLGEALEMSCTWLILTILRMYTMVRMSVLGGCHRSGSVQRRRHWSVRPGLWQWLIRILVSSGSVIWQEDTLMIQAWGTGLFIFIIITIACM